MRWFPSSLMIALLVAVCASSVHAQLTSPQIGWEADFGTGSHNVAGTVSVLDEDTLLFDDFTYDGGGISVYFYLAPVDSQSSFNSQGALQIGMELFGTVFDGTQEPFTVDLPGGQTLEGFNAISVWCVAVGANFGSGTFLEVDPMGDFDGNGVVDGNDFLKWQRGESPNPLSQSDLDSWEANYGTVISASASLTAVPEPATWLGLLLGMTAIFFRRKAVAF